METNDELKNNDFKYLICNCFDDIIKIEDVDFDNILIEENSYEIVLVYNIFYKNLIGAKPFPIRLDKLHGFIRVYDETRYLVLFEEKISFLFW